MMFLVADLPERQGWALGEAARVLFTERVGRDVGQGTEDRPSHFTEAFLSGVKR